MLLLPLLLSVIALSSRESVFELSCFRFELSEIGAELNLGVDVFFVKHSDLYYERVVIQNIIDVFPHSALSALWLFSQNEFALF